MATTRSAQCPATTKGQNALEADIIARIARFNQSDTTMAVPSEYLEAVITRR